MVQGPHKELPKGNTSSLVNTETQSTAVPRSSVGEDGSRWLPWVHRAPRLDRCPAFAVGPSRPAPQVSLPLALAGGWVQALCSGASVRSSKFHPVTTCRYSMWTSHFMEEKLSSWGCGGGPQSPSGGGGLVVPMGDLEVQAGLGGW